MSYIDCFKHRELGLISGIPLYQALDVIDGDEFECEVNQLVLGGGGGEHKGAVVDSIDDCIRSAIIVSEHIDVKSYQDFNNNENSNFTLYETYWIVDYYSWMIKDIVDYNNECVKEGFSSDCIVDSIEIWTVMKIAKLVIDGYPGLIDKDLFKNIDLKKLSKDIDIVISEKESCES